MTEKVKRPRLSKNQRKILEILEKYHELTARDIAEILGRGTYATKRQNTVQFTEASQPFTKEAW